MRKLQRFGFSLCIAAERFMLQQSEKVNRKCPSYRNTTRQYNFQPQPAIPTLQNVTIRSVTDTQADRQTVKGKGTVQPLMEVFHGTATEYHFHMGSHSVTCYPDTSEHTPP